MTTDTHTYTQRKYNQCQMAESDSIMACERNGMISVNGFWMYFFSFLWVCVCICICVSFSYIIHDDDDESTAQNCAVF